MCSGHNTHFDFDATIVIATKDRRDELRKALESAFAQVDVHIEVLVLDDGSTDGTSEMVRDVFPAARLERSAASRGYIAQRNRGARMASAPVVVSLDDDAVFSTPHVVRATLDDLSDPLVGAVAIPWVNMGDGPDAPVNQKAPDGSQIYCTNAYTGLAHAVRRDSFLALGGYQEYLIHGGEELEFCTRLLDAGYVTRLGTADPIFHYESPVRNLDRQYYYGARSSVL